MAQRKRPPVAVQLSEKWAVGYDDSQWIVYRGKSYDPISFVGSTKDVLERVLRENGAEIDIAGRAALDALPEKFVDFIEARKREQ